MQAGRLLMGPAARHHAGMRGERPRGRRVRLREGDSPPGEPREVRRRVAAVAVEAHAVGPHRVEHDQQDIRRLRAPGWGRRQRGHRPVFTEHVAAEREADQADHADGQYRRCSARPAAGKPRGWSRSRGSRHEASPPARINTGPEMQTLVGQEQGHQCKPREQARGAPHRPARPGSSEQGQQQAAEAEQDQVDDGDRPENVTVHPEKAGRRVAQVLQGQRQAQLGQPDDQAEPDRDPEGGARPERFFLRRRIAGRVPAPKTAGCPQDICGETSRARSSSSSMKA